MRSQKFSSGLLIQPDLPFIGLINDDRLPVGIMIFYIKEGDTILGKDDNCSDICNLIFILNFRIKINKLFKALNDKNLSDTHCIFSNSDGIVTLTPVDKSICIVNGVDIRTKFKLTQGKKFSLSSCLINFLFLGDLIQVGKYTFKFNHPEESAKLAQSDKVN